MREVHVVAEEQPLHEAVGASPVRTVAAMGRVTTRAGGWLRAGVAESDRALK